MRRNSEFDVLRLHHLTGHRCAIGDAILHVLSVIVHHSILVLSAGLEAPDEDETKEEEKSHAFLKRLLVHYRIQSLRDTCGG